MIVKIIDLIKSVHRIRQCRQMRLEAESLVKLGDHIILKIIS